MNTTQQRVDINLWNLDGLGIRDEREKKGEVSVFPLKKDQGPIGRTLIIYNDKLAGNRILLLRPRDRIVQSIDPEKNSSQVHHNYKDEDFVDMTVHNGYLFVLLRSKRGQEIRQYRVTVDRLLVVERWFITSADLTPLTRIAVTPWGTVKNASYSAFIGPCEDHQIWSLRLDTDNTRIEESNIIVRDSTFSLGEEIDFCVDARNRTLIIADTMNHRVVEVDIESGRTELLCGTGQPGNSLEERNPANALLNSPNAVAIYRPEELINPGLLDEPSRNLLQHDPRKITPRTLLIADSGNLRIKKLVQFPLTARRSDLPQKPLLYSFIGSGQFEAGSHKPTDEHEKDLRTYPLPMPSYLAISSFGEMLIGCKSAPTLILLRPATAKNDRVVFETSDKRGYSRS